MKLTPKEEFIKKQLILIKKQSPEKLRMILRKIPSPPPRPINKKNLA